MHIVYWVAAVLAFFGAIGAILAVGKAREILTGEVAAWIVIFRAFYVFLFIYAAFHL